MKSRTGDDGNQIDLILAEPFGFRSNPIKGFSRGLANCRSEWFLDGRSTRDSRPSATNRSYASSHVGM